MLRESYAASMWLAYGYVNSSPAKLDRLRRTAEDHVMAWVADHEPATGVAPRVAGSKVLDADRVQVDVEMPGPAAAVPWRDLIARFLYVGSEDRIERLSPLSAAAP